MVKTYSRFDGMGYQSRRAAESGFGRSRSRLSCKELDRSL
jgi:hypothetical protein